MKERIKDPQAAPGSQEPPELAGTLSKVRALRNRKEDWDGHGSMAPDLDAVSHAVAWIREMYHDRASLEQAWIEPNVASSEKGEVVFEWWRGHKKLTVYVSATSADYVKVWGTDILNDMEDGSLSDSARREMWVWLTTDRT